MTTEEELKHFQSICAENARKHSAKVLDGYMNALEKAYEERTADARRRADIQVGVETEKLEREINKRLSVGQLDLKREFSHRQEELKDELFMELKDKLANLMEIREYQQLLDHQVKEARASTGDEELTIYVNPSDGGEPQRIAMHHNASIRLSEYSFTRDIKAVIPDKHTSIDNLFETKLNEARYKFKFDLEGK